MILSGNLRDLARANLARILAFICVAVALWLAAAMVLGRDDCADCGPVAGGAAEPSGL